MDIQKAREEIVAAAASCYRTGLVSAAGGNISMRVGEQMLITATNESFRELTTDGIVTVAMDGTLVHAVGDRKPSKEKNLHLEVYRRKPDMRCVIHVHPVYSIAYTVAAGQRFPLPTVSAVAKLKEIGFVPVAGGGSSALVDGISAALEKGPDYMRVLLLERHGIVVYEKDMKNCLDLTELMEETAKINVLISAVTHSTGIADAVLP
ncbi:MAG: class II aldolase/adducin family protein [Methylobacteriaceae bacterium]|jgi:L-fuculose-phosphate aldolase|nr:class II aldolase/adducin family protein [Methylobacteriaceae bacterium]